MQCTFYKHKWQKKPPQSPFQNNNNNNKSNPFPTFGRWPHHKPTAFLGPTPKSHAYTAHSCIFTTTAVTAPPVPFPVAFSLFFQTSMAFLLPLSSLYKPPFVLSFHLVIFSSHLHLRFHGRPQRSKLFFLIFLVFSWVFFFEFMENGWLWRGMEDGCRCRRLGIGIWSKGCRITPWISRRSEKRGRLTSPISPEPVWGTRMSSSPSNATPPPPPMITVSLLTITKSPTNPPRWDFFFFSKVFEIWGFLVWKLSTFYGLFLFSFRWEIIRIYG